MKISFLSTAHPIYDKFPAGGGIQSQILGLSKALVGLDHEVTIFSRFRGVPEQTIEGIKILGVKTLLKDEVLTRLIFSYFAAKKIRELKPDILNLTERFSAYFPSKLRIKKAFFTHNSDAFSFYREFSVKYNKLNYFFFDIKQQIEEGIMRRSDLVFPLNKSVENYLHEQGISNNWVIPNGVDPALYENKGDGGYILYGGRLSKAKCIDDLIIAFKGLSDTYKLIIVGSGPDKNRLNKIVKKLNLGEKVIFNPWVGEADFRRYMSKCTVFVLPSLAEISPVSLLEAMASCKPVVASNIMGTKDIISHGKDGFLFEKRNIEQLKKVLELCLHDEKIRDRIGKNARKKILENYSFDRIALDLEKRYIELIA